VAEVPAEAARKEEVMSKPAKPGAKKPRAKKGGTLKAPKGHLEMLLEIAATVVLFHSPDHRCFAECPEGSHVENHEIKSTGFRRWLVNKFFVQHQTSPTADALQRAILTLESGAIYEGTETPVYVRIAPGDGDSVYIDLGGQAWDVVHVDATGWKIVDRPPVRFIRPRGLRPLPRATKGGTLDNLWDFLNHSEGDRPLILAFMTQSLRATGPYPVLELSGEQGSAKSTFAKVIRSLVDPHSCMLRSEPREGRDLWIAASNSWLAAFDNLSRLPEWLSDGLCRLSTGGGFAVRSLYSDNDEVFFDGQRPCLLAGIDGVTVRGDLVDRSIKIALPTIREAHRKLESTFWEDFENTSPLIFGAILTALSRGMERVRRTDLDRFPRMADFAKWGEAVCRASGSADGEFMEAYEANRKDANESILEDSPVASHLRRTVKPGARWEGTATELLNSMNSGATEQARQHRQWPKSSRMLAGTLRRLAPALRSVGIEVGFSREGHERTRRIIVINEVDDLAASGVGNSPSASSASSKTPCFTGKAADDCGRCADGCGRCADDPSSASSAAQNNGKAPVTESADAADGADDEIRTFLQRDDENLPLAAAPGGSNDDQPMESFDI
jgi:hypothetical protein